MGCRSGSPRPFSASQPVKASETLLTINGGSSSIKFALFETVSLQRILSGRIERIGLANPEFRVKGENPRDNFTQPALASTHEEAVETLTDWIGGRPGGGPAAIGHRIVHGGPDFAEAVRLTPQVLSRLRQLEPLDPEHLLEETRLAEAFLRRFPGRPQIACFDSAFFHDLPRVAQLLPIPRRYEAKGLRRYGFHGLSYAYLLDALARAAGADAAAGRLVLAHLGNGASLAAVRNGQPIDTTMSLTPTAGIPMGTRSGDLDPGIVGYLGRTEGMNPDRFNRFVNFECGLLGVSETSPDMRDLLKRVRSDARAAEAVELFCYSARKAVGALAAALGGIDTIVFAGGIGENAPEVREGICAGLEFLGVRLDAARNASGAPVISAPGSAVQVRVIPTDEELTIARSVVRVLGQTAAP